MTREFRSYLDLHNRSRRQTGRKMITDIEKKIRDLQKELAEVQREQAALRLQPCKGDAEIRKKDEKFDELEGRVKILRESIRHLTRKRQLSISEPTPNGS